MELAKELFTDADVEAIDVENGEEEEEAVGEAASHHRRRVRCAAPRIQFYAIFTKLLVIKNAACRRFRWCNDD